MWTVVFSQNSSEAGWRFFLTDLLLKITIVLAAGGALAWLLRRQSAAAKHLVWTLSLLSCLLVPGAMLLLPGWGIEHAINTGSESVHRFKPVSTSSATSDHAPPSPATSGRYVVDRPGAEFPPSIDRIQPMDSEPVELKLNRGERITANSPLNWLLITWLTGCVIVMLPLIGGIARVAFLCRQSAIVSGKSWGRLVSEISHAIHLRRTVTLRRSHALDISLCGGIIRPVRSSPSRQHVVDA